MSKVRWLIRDGDGGGKGEKEWRLDCMLQPGRLRRLWTTARTTKMLRLCPFAIAYRTIAVSTSVQSSHKQYCWVTTEAKEVQLSKLRTTSLLLISLGPAQVSSFFVRVQLTSLFLISPGLCWHQIIFSVFIETMLPLLLVSRFGLAVRR